MHMVFALLCFVAVIHWLIFHYPSGLLRWHCGNLTIAPVPAKQPWWIWINTSCEFIMNDCITTTKQSTTQPCAYFLGCTVGQNVTSLTSSFYERYIQDVTSILYMFVLCCGWVLTNFIFIIQDYLTGFGMILWLTHMMARYIWLPQWSWRNHEDHSQRNKINLLKTHHKIDQNKA